MKTAEEYLKENEFIANEHGNYIYSNGAHSFNLKIILNDFAQQVAEKVRQDCVKNAGLIYTSDATDKVSHYRSYGTQTGEVEVDRESILQTPITLE